MLPQVRTGGSTLLYPTLLYSRVCYATYSTLLYSTLLYFSPLYSTLLYPTLLHSLALYSTLLYPTPVYSSILSDTLCHLNRNLRQPYSKQLKNDLSDSWKTSKSDGLLFVFILCALSHLAANMTPRMTSHDQKSSDKKLKVDQDSCLGRKTNWEMTSQTRENQAKVMDCCSFSYFETFPT
jgi:hypothetical protein